MVLPSSWQGFFHALTLRGPAGTAWRKLCIPDLLGRSPCAANSLWDRGLPWGPCLGLFFRQRLNYQVVRDGPATAPRDDRGLCIESLFWAPSWAL